MVPLASNHPATIVPAPIHARLAPIRPANSQDFAVQTPYGSASLPATPQLVGGLVKLGLVAVIVWGVVETTKARNPAPVYQIVLRPPRKSKSNKAKSRRR